MGNGSGSFILKSGPTVVDVNAVHKIPSERCNFPGTKRAVLLAEVKKGVLKEGDEIVLKNPAGEILNDVVVRLEVKCEPYDQVAAGVNVGVLLMNHSPEELTRFGLPLHRVGSSNDRHP